MQAIPPSASSSSQSPPPPGEAAILRFFGQGGTYDDMDKHDAAAEAIAVAPDNTIVAVGDRAEEVWVRKYAP